MIEVIKLEVCDPMHMWWKIKRLFQKFKFKPILEFFVAIATIASVILVYFTLRELQIERDNAFMPDVIMETSKINVAWGDLSKLEEDPLFQNASKESEMNPASIKFSFLNIGVGTAKNIKFFIGSSTIEKWINFLKEKNPESDYSYQINANRMIAVIDGEKMSFSSYLRNEKLYLLPNANEAYKYFVPYEYALLIQKLAQTNKYLPYRPYIEMIIEYSDVQGKIYKKNAILLFKPTRIINDTNGNGFASYEISMVNER